MAYSQQDKNTIFQSIISNIENGASLRSAVINYNKNNNSNFSRDTFNEWLKQNKTYSDQYARAIDDRIELKFESIEKDYLEEPQRDKESGKIDTGWVQLQRLKIDAKKWELGKLKPKKYGDRIDVTTDGEKIFSNTIQIEVIKPNDESNTSI